MTVDEKAKMLLLGKLCGKHEECFEHGEKYWGTVGGVFCYHLTETKDRKDYCHKYDMEVKLYTKESQYKTYKHI